MGRYFPSVRYQQINGEINNKYSVLKQVGEFHPSLAASLYIRDRKYSWGHFLHIYRYPFRVVGVPVTWRLTFDNHHQSTAIQGNFIKYWFCGRKQTAAAIAGEVMHVSNLVFWGWTRVMLNHPILSGRETQPPWRSSCGRNCHNLN